MIKGLNQSALTFLMQAEYSTSEVDTDRVDRGFRHRACRKKSH